MVRPPGRVFIASERMGVFGERRSSKLACWALVAKQASSGRPVKIWPLGRGGCHRSFCRLVIRKPRDETGLNVRCFSKPSAIGPFSALISLLAALPIGSTAAQGNPDIAPDGETSAAANAPSDSSGPSDSWKLTGFGTVGVLHADSDEPWLFARDLTQRGAPGNTAINVDSRLGLQLERALAPSVEAVAQLVVKDRSRGARADESLEWAFIGWQPSPAVKLRFGRTSPDLFLLADVRNVGITYPWVRPSVEYYGWMPFSSMDGIDASYRWQTGSVYWTGKIAVGRIRSTIGVVDREQYAHVQGDDTLAVTFSRESGGLLLKASYLRTRLASELPAQFQPLSDGLLGLTQLPVPTVAAEADRLYQAMQFGGVSQYSALGAQYEANRWALYAEGSRVHFDRGASGGTRGYVSLAYRWPRLTGYVISARSKPDSSPLKLEHDWAAELTPVLGPELAGQAAMLGIGGAAAANLPRFDQQTIGIGLRWDVRQNVDLKLQVDRTLVHRYGSIAWRDATDNSNHATIFSVAADFTF